jgi:transcriptional regulator with XRE-family HTH domain
MKYPIGSPEDLGLIIRSVRKHARVRRDDLAASVGVSQQFAFDVERGKPTIQFGRMLRILQELGIRLNVEVPDDIGGSSLDELKQEQQTRQAKRTLKHGS